MSAGGLLGLLLALLLLLPLASFQQSGATAILDIVSKRYSAGYVPVVGSYVEYEVRLTNTGDQAIEGQSLQVSLVSEGNRTHSAVAYSVPLLEPGGSKTLHLGPFKMEEEGQHRLLVELDGTDLGSDSFVVYTAEAVQAALVAIPLIAAGAGIVGFSLYRKRNAV